MYVYGMSTSPNSQLLKGSLSVMILRLLEGRDRMYGYEITQKVKELTVGEMTVTEGPFAGVAKRQAGVHVLLGQGSVVVEQFG